MGRRRASGGRGLAREGREHADLAAHGYDRRALVPHGDLGLRDMIFRKESLGGSHEGQRTDGQTTTVAMLKYHPVSEHGLTSK